MLIEEQRAVQNYTNVFNCGRWKQTSDIYLSAGIVDRSWEAAGK